MPLATLSSPSVPTPAAVRPLAHYRFHLRCVRGGMLPNMAGSALRGVLGTELKRQVCVTRHASCDDCLLRSRCPYPGVFESSVLPVQQPGNGREGPASYTIQSAWQDRPARIRVGEAWHFGMTLSGIAVAELPRIIAVWQRGLARDFTGSRLGFTLERVTHQIFHPGGVQTSVVWEQGASALQAHTTWVEIPPPPDWPVISLQLESPHRINVRRELMRAEAFDWSGWYLALRRRVAVCGECHLENTLGAVLEQAETARPETAFTLRQQDWRRYSNRQARSMHLPGMMGRIELAGAWQALWPLLYLGQWLHVGKNSAFGLGSFRLEKSASSSVPPAASAPSSSVVHHAGAAAQSTN